MCNHENFAFFTTMANIGCAHVIGASASQANGNTWTFAATVKSADTGWDKYADQWIVLDGESSMLGTKDLLHPHETEQPFTRSLSGVVVPTSVDYVKIAARDSVAGFCGSNYTLSLFVRPSCSSPVMEPSVAPSISEPTPETSATADSSSVMIIFLMCLILLWNTRM
jgi:hypothetical protein